MMPPGEEFKRITDVFKKGVKFSEEREIRAVETESV